MTLIQEQLPTCQRAAVYCRKHPLKIILSAVGGIVFLVLIAVSALFWVAWKTGPIGDPVSLGR